MPLFGPAPPVLPYTWQGPEAREGSIVVVEWRRWRRASIRALLRRCSAALQLPIRVPAVRSTSHAPGSQPILQARGPDCWDETYYLQQNPDLK